MRPLFRLLRFANNATENIVDDARVVRGCERDCCCGCDGGSIEYTVGEVPAWET